MGEQMIEVIARGVWMQDGRALLCREIERGYFFLPGGPVEFGETAAEALQREMAEELGLSLQVGCFLGGLESAFDQADGSGTIAQHHEINLVFELSGRGIEPADVVSQESHITFEWCHVDEVAGPEPAIQLLPPDMATLINTAAHKGNTNWLSRWE